MSNHSAFTVRDGLATLGAEAVQMRTRLEERFLAWASDCGADAMLFPPLMAVADLDKFDFFRNFPHLALIATRIQKERVPEYARGTTPESLPSEHLTAGEYALPSAACYNIYLHLRDATLDGPKYITTVANCFRNEEEYKGLQRLCGFSMREIVCVGTAEEVRAHLTSFKQRIGEFAAGIGLPLETQVATDPFYEPQNSRALMQKLFPVKEEFVYGGSVAIASVNFHRNFFGERCNIRTPDGQPAHSGCVAFGIERWLHALLDHFGGDTSAILKKIS